MRVRDELKMTIAAYQTLYKSAVAFGSRKQIQAEQGKKELNDQIATLEARKKDLEDRRVELENKKKTNNNWREHSETALSFLSLQVRFYLHQLPM